MAIDYTSTTVVCGSDKHKNRIISKREKKNNNNDIIVQTLERAYFLIHFSPIENLLSYNVIN